MMRSSKSGLLMSYWLLTRRVSCWEIETGRVDGGINKHLHQRSHNFITRQFDVKYWFAVVKAWQKPDATITEYTYDLWGNVLTATDVTNSNSPLKTTYAYNGWGDLIKTVLPTGADGL